MDSIILSFTPEQYKKYLGLKELRTNADIKLDFDFAPRDIEEYSMEKAHFQINSIKDTALSLLAFEHKDSIFPVPFTKDEMNELIPAYFEAVGSMDEAKRVLNREMSNIFTHIARLDEEYCRICAEYSDFLPYKAALYDDARYSERIGMLDASFRKIISSISAAIEKEQQKCSSLQKICEDIIPQFFKASSIAGNSPRFEHFHANDFFKSVRVFVERMNNIRLYPKVIEPNQF